MKGSSRKLFRKIAILAACIVAVSGATAGAASAATVYGGTPLMSAPYSNSWWYGSSPWTEYSRMDCWVDTTSWAYGTNRWFRVAMFIYNPRSGRFESGYGYASANRFPVQDRVVHC